MNDGLLQRELTESSVHRDSSEGLSKRDGVWVMRSLARQAVGLIVPPAPVGLARELDSAGWLGAVSGAAALALAGVLALASLVAGLAAASSLAIVLALTGVLGRRGILTGAEQAGLGNSGLGVVGVRGGIGRNRRSTDQAGKGCRQQESIQLVLHFDLAFGVGAEGSAGCGLAGSAGEPAARIQCHAH